MADNKQSFLKKNKIYVIAGGVVFALILFSLFKNGSTPEVKVDNTTNSEIGTSGQGIETLPGTSERRSYNELQQKENEKNVKNAMEKGESSLPVLVNNNQNDKNDPFNSLNLNITQPIHKEETPVIDTTPPEVPAPVIQPAPIVQPQVSVAPVAPPAYNSQERTDQRQKVQAQLEGYLTQWTAKPSRQERNKTGEELEENKSIAGNGVNQSGGNNSVNSAPKGALIAKAGTIIPAVMITSLNSDEPGPVMAQIVSGKLKGARLIGTMQSSDKRIVVKFDKISIVGHNQTYDISAYAVDPNTSRTALASDVDNHYFLRYGLGLAAAFVSGYGEAVQNKGTTTTVGPLGNVTQTRGDLNHSEIAESALGKVGQKFGTELERDTNRRPTVTVDSGVAIGALLMRDF